MTTPKNPQRLYHPHLLGLVFVLLLLAGCAPLSPTPASLIVKVTADGQTLDVQVPDGGTVQDALDSARVSLGPVDRVEPSTFTGLVPGIQIRVVRVVEKFEVEQEEIPFEQQRQPTELLPEGEKRMDPLQPGQAGRREITYRIVYEDGVEVSRDRFKSVVIQDQVPQIVLVGVRPLQAPLEIPGRLVYLIGGNAWMMEGTTGDRKPLINTGDLDGRVLSLSEDGSWLLYTRKSASPEKINELWAANLSVDPLETLDLKVANVIHFAGWVPGSNNRVVYSTVEPSVAAPGWQANNDLKYLTIYKSGAGSFTEVGFTASLGGSYGWWGVDFAWAPDGRKLAYSNSNGVGWIGTSKEETPQPLLEFSPLQTRSDWAWTPGMSWGPDGRMLYTVAHVALPGSTSPDESQLFDLVAVPAGGGGALTLASNVGMFAYPAASPKQDLSTGEMSYQVAYLQAAFPTQSESSPYRIMLMDRDGSNRRELFPPEGEPGLEPQELAWSPAPLSAGGGYALAVVYQGNLWLVETSSGKIHQVTGDGLVSRVVWKGE